MPQLKMTRFNKIKLFKYEMEKRRDKWKFVNDPLEKLLTIPLEEQSKVVRDLVSEPCYNYLTQMLPLETGALELSQEKVSSSVETIIPFIPRDKASIASGPRMSVAQQSVMSSITKPSLSESITSSQYESASASVPSKETITQMASGITITTSPSEPSEIVSDFVEVEKKITQDEEHVKKHKAILRFLNLPEWEAATWRVKEAKDVSDLSQMTLEEQGDFLINKIAADFCEWMRKLGGDEKSFISEDILKELFQVGMDNPASRAICVKMREKQVLYYKLANFLGVPEKSFHDILSLHLNWDAKVEKKPSELFAFGKSLPKNMRFKTPKNKTVENWLEWNKLSPEQLSFADVYSTIKDLRSTKEYCKWLLEHPEYKKPQYLVDQNMFQRISDGEVSLIRFSENSNAKEEDHVVPPNLEGLFKSKYSLVKSANNEKD